MPQIYPNSVKRLVYLTSAVTESPIFNVADPAELVSAKWHPKRTLPSNRLVLDNVTYGSGRFVAVSGSMQTIWHR